MPNSFWFNQRGASGRRHSFFLFCSLLFFLASSLASGEDFKTILPFEIDLLLDGHGFVSFTKSVGPGSGRDHSQLICNI